MHLIIIFRCGQEDNDCGGLFKQDDGLKGDLLKDFGVCKFRDQGSVVTGDQNYTWNIMRRSIPENSGYELANQSENERDWINKIHTVLNYALLNQM